MKKHLLLIALLLSIIACNAKQLETTKAVITGHIVGFEKVKKHNKITFKLYDLLNDRDQYTVNIDADGNFKYEIDLNFPTEFTLNYRYRMTYVLSPGDSLHFEIDAKCWKGKHPTKASQYKFYTLSGIGKELNENVSAFYALFHDSLWSNDASINATLKYDALAYRTFQDSLLQTYFVALNQFNKDNNTSDEFDKWATSYIQYKNLYHKISYSFDKPYMTKQNYKTYIHQMPKSYFDFLDDISDKRPEVISSSYTAFMSKLHGYTWSSMPLDSQKVFSGRNDSILKEKEQYILKRYKALTTGYNYDVMVSKMYYSHLKFKRLERFENEYQPELIKDSFLRQQIEEKYNYEVKLLEDAEFAEEILLEQISKCDVLTEILDKNKGKVIYLDFWAPSCVPCLAEMPHAKKIKTHYANKDVVFVNISCYGKKSDWKACIEKHSITGENHLLSNIQYKALKEIFEIYGIPQFALINKEGKIVEKKTVRPSSKNKLIKKIDALLVEKDS